MNILSALADIATILTAVVAIGAAIYFGWRRHERVERLERYLEAANRNYEKGGQDGPARRVARVMADCFMTEAQVFDIDQAWRLSRFCWWGGVSAFDPWRRLPPMRRGRSDRFQGRDRLGIRQDQFGALGAGASAAARQSALLGPGV